MFTGIVEELGTVLSVRSNELVIRACCVLQDTAVKESIAVDGTCLTITERGDDWFRVDTMPETLRCTRLGTLQSGSVVNLERSLAANGRVGGHMVQGHVESTAPILALKADGIALDMQIGLPERLRPYIIPKGFIAVNGVSLTVVDCTSDSFSIALIPYTREHTNLGQLKVGELLNLETDIVGRYVMQYLKQYSQSSVI
jgi:riboflavin synthase